MFSLTTIIQINVSIFLIFIVKIEADCREDNDKQFTCSMKDLERTEIKDDWNSIKINSDSGKQDIKENAFENFPNIKKLVFEGSVNRINRNAFKGLNKLDVLQFFNCDIPELQGNIFANLPIAELLIYTSNLQILKPRCLDNLVKLTRVLFYKNSIANIPAGVFSYTNIENLYLNENGISTIEPEAFLGMEKLKLLGLERNHLTTFDSKLYVGTSSPLNILWLAWNNFTKINKNMLEPYYNLKVLLMQGNSVETIDNGTFDNNKELKYIDISNNKLEKLSHRIFPWEGLEKMDVLFIQNNRLIDLSTDVIDKLPRLRTLAIGGNPWLCSCFQKLRNYLSQKNIRLPCDNKYLEGKRPICINPSVVTNECNTENESVQNLYDLYIEAQMQYLKLPPLCKIFCGSGNGSCYSHDFDVIVY